MEVKKNILLNGSLDDFLRVVTENLKTDRQTERHTHKPSTVTLTAHACQGLIVFAAGNTFHGSLLFAELRSDPPPSWMLTGACPVICLHKLFIRKQSSVSFENYADAFDGIPFYYCRGKTSRRRHWPIYYCPCL